MSLRLVPTTIMWWLSCATVRGDRAIHIVAEARDEGVDDAARGAVALDQGDLADARAPCRHRRGREATFESLLQRPRRRLVLDDADDARRHLVRALGGGDVEVLAVRSRADVDGVLALKRDRRRRECRP